ncbi:hypothetical protein Tco_0831729 [Tanacetum coccineum]
MDDPNITMEEYIQLMADKAHKFGQMFNWETATYDKIYDDIDLFKDFEVDFLAVVYNDELASDPKVSSEPTLISINDLKLDTCNNIDEINVKLPSEDISIKPLDSVINVNVDTYSQKFDKTIETNHDTPGLSIWCIHKYDTAYSTSDQYLVIMEYLVNISKRRAFWSLNEDILKITILTPIRRIHQGRYGVSVPALTKYHKEKKINTPYLEEVNMPY